ncbi:mariner Mos1 transposase [Trichonephila clavipes]|nr:mariner Mos1 transposase [Trichonephila clavipes]
MLCIFWDQEGPIYYELLKPDETVNTDRYKQELLNLNNAILEKREQYKKRQHKVIFLDDNAPSHRPKPTKDIVKALVAVIHHLDAPYGMSIIKKYYQQVLLRDYSRQWRK